MHILNPLKRINLKKRERALGFGISPHADWRTIFIALLLLGLVAVAFGAYMFIRVDKGEVFIVEKKSDDTVRHLDPKELQRVVEYYQGKAEQYESLKTLKPSGITDPSQ